MRSTDVKIPYETLSFIGIPALICLLGVHACQITTNDDVEQAKLENEYKIERQKLEMVVEKQKHAERMKCLEMKGTYKINRVADRNETYATCQF